MYREVYKVDCLPILARGLQCGEDSIVNVLAERVAYLYGDISGRQEILNEVLNPLAKTSFEMTRLQEILESPPDDDDWRVGEAMAEAFLVDHRSCEFPWPCWRDLKNTHASPAGTDLVGFHCIAGQPRLAFAEVKTSHERQWPPSVVHGRHGLAKQVEELRDNKRVKDDVVRYLAHRARKSDWLETFQVATGRYLTNPTDVSLFGVLIRDVEPKSDDVRSRAKLLSKNCPEATTIELHAIYLPEDAMPGFVEHVKTFLKRSPV